MAAPINLCILIEASKFYTERITCTKSRRCCPVDAAQWLPMKEMTREEISKKDQTRVRTHDHTLQMMLRMPGLKGEIPHDEKGNVNVLQ